MLINPSQDLPTFNILYMANDIYKMMHNGYLFIINQASRLNHDWRAV